MSKSPIPVIAAGGVVFRIVEDETKVLLIYRNGFWDLPKGKLEKGESIPMCAVREVGEEVGSGIPALLFDLGTTFHSYEQKGKSYDKTTYWYSMIFTKEESLVPQGEEGIEKIEWVELEEAIEKVGFDNLKEVLIRFSRA